MTAVALRKEIHTIIDAISDQSLLEIKTALTHLAEDYWLPVLEPASPEEIAMMEKGMKERRINPPAFASLDKIK